MKVLADVEEQRGIKANESSGVLVPSQHVPMRHQCCGKRNGTLSTARPLLGRNAALDERFRLQSPSSSQHSSLLPYFSASLVNIGATSTSAFYAPRSPHALPKHQYLLLLRTLGEATPFTIAVEILMNCCAVIKSPCALKMPPKHFILEESNAKQCY